VSRLLKYTGENLFKGQYQINIHIFSSVADPDPKSGIRIRNPESGSEIRDPDPESMIRIRDEHPGLYLRELRSNFLD
jgi:hypothetical protein